ncbi:MAG TPA: NAD-dependent epimerase/dehydratase family protein, partial [Ilumatobacteraceae bacterium]|nr:NAD-dependent epimerase/dehydratase family protein [Ilumatobacteraceae bacterium]
MRVVVTGASGNVGSRILPRLLANDEVEDIVGIARRAPQPPCPDRLSWVCCDIGERDAPQVLRRTFTGADVVVHLAWQIQPSRDLERMRRTNIDGSRNVFSAAVDGGVGAIVYASSVGAYSAGPKHTPVDENWPTDGIPSSTYARHKSEVERLLDPAAAAGLRTVRFRPALIFQAAAGSEIARYFLGPFVPLSLLRRRLLPTFPSFDRLVFQAVHTDDVAAAFVHAVVDAKVDGAFNLASDPVIDSAVLSRPLDARAVPVPLSVIRAASTVAYRLRLQPTDAGWVDMAAGAPVMSSDRARRELNWSPRHSSIDALLELLDAMRQGDGAPTPVLQPAPSSAAGRAIEAAKVAGQGGA